MNTVHLTPSVLPGQVHSYNGAHNGAFFCLMRRISIVVKNCFSPFVRRVFPKGPEFVVHVLKTEDSNREVDLAKKLLKRVLRTRVRRRIEIIQAEDVNTVDLSGKRVLSICLQSPTSTDLVLSGTWYAELVRRSWSVETSRGLLYFDDSISEVDFMPELIQEYEDHHSFWTPRSSSSREETLRHWLGA